MNSMLSAWVEGIGFLAPGLPDWPAACALLRGESHYQEAPSLLPVPTLLPAAERRRASRVVKLALAVGLEAATQAQADIAALATVFSASGADGHNCHALCEQLAGDDRLISPTRFHNSVHNAAAGYWGIATGAMAPCQVIGAYDASFGAGLLDALAQVVVDRQRTLLIAYDSEYPHPLYSCRPVPDVAGVGLVLAPERSPQALARITVGYSRDAAPGMDDVRLEMLRAGVPALRALPLLARLARGETGPVVISYLAPLQLRVVVEAC